MKAYKLLLILLSVIIIEGCGSKKNNSYDNANQLVNYTQANINVLTVTDFEVVQQHIGEYKIIDCREAEKYIHGHIPRAINIPRGVLEFSDKISNRRETIYVYSQNNDRASLACYSLKLLKYNKVYLIDGGWIEWYKTFPKLLEKGDGDTGNKPAPKVEESSGCG